MKKVSVVVPCYNEEENVVNIANAIEEQFKTELENKYDYEIIFIDNCSTDKTQELICQMCEKNFRIKAIFNARNFGQFNSPYHALLQTYGDCTISIAADFQEPPELISKFVKEWENGNKIVIGVKNKTTEKSILRFGRGFYYKLIKKFSEAPIIEHFTGFGLYDKEFIDILREIDDPTPFFRGIVAEFGFKIKEIEFVEPLRKGGKSKNSFYTLYDAAMLSFTSYTKVGLRLATFSGIIIACMSFLIGLGYLIAKIIFWNNFSAGMAPLLIGMFFLGAVQLFFIGFLGEYIMAINERVKHRPLVIEEKRINFE